MIPDPDESPDRGEHDPTGTTDDAPGEPGPRLGLPPVPRRSVTWLADYVYGTISTLVAIAGLTFEFP